MYVLIFIFFELFESCMILKEKLEISISTYECMFWEIKDELIDGEMAKFKLEGDENGTYFRLQQPNDIYYKSYYPYCMKLKPSTRNEGNYISKTFEESVLGLSSLGYQIFTWNEQTSNLFIDVPCSDFDYLDQENFVVLCQDGNSLRIGILNKNGVYLDQYTIQADSKQYKLALYQSKQITYLLIYVPAFAESEFNIQSVINVYLIENLKIKSTPYYLDKKKLSDLFQNELKYFSVIDIQIFYNKLYVLDYKLGPIYLTQDEVGNFNYAKLITSSITINEYYALVISNENQILILGLMQQKMSLIELSNGRINLITTLFNQTFKLGRSRLQKTPNYYLITSEDKLIIFDQNKIIDILNYEIFVANPDFDLYTIYGLKSLDFYEISSGILTFKKIQNQQNEMYFRLVLDTCKVDIVVKVYGRFDAKLHSNYYTDFYNTRVLYYPPYPNNYYEWPRMTSGPNLLRAITHDNQELMEFKALSPLKVSGISQFDQNTVVFSLIKYNMGMNQYLVQSESLSAFIYDCKLNDLEQKCSQKISFFPLTKLNEDNIQWIEFDTYDSFMGIKTQNNHVITIYRIQATKIYQLFQIKTSLQDEKMEIIDFSINSNFVFVLLKDSTQILIYSLSLKKQIDQITNLENAQKIYTSNYFNKNLLFIKCNNKILIGHYSYEFNVISEITITQQIDVSLKLTIFRTTLVVVYKTSTEQGILQYLIHNLNSVSLLRKLPLYYYQLPLKLQLASNPLKNLILITAYSADTQTTVILVYQINEYQRNSLITLIDTTYYFEEELNYCIVGQYDSIIQFIFKGQTYSYLFFEQPRLYANLVTQHYQETIQINQIEWNDFYQEKLVYSKDITLIDMNLNLKWKNNITIEIKEMIKKNDTDKIEEQQIIIDTNWVEGQMISYKLSCIMCTTDNDSGQIYLLNQFRKTNIEVQTKFIADMINFDQNTILVLTEFTITNHYLQFIDNEGQVVKEVEVEKILDYAANKLFLLTQNILIIAFQNMIAKQPVLKYFYCDLLFCEYKTKLKLPGLRLIIDIEYYNGYMILLSNIPEQSPTLTFYKIEEYVIIQCDLIISEYYFHKNFNVTAFEIHKKTNEIGVLILSESELGLIVIEIFFDTKIEVISYQFINLPFQKQQLIIPEKQKYTQLKILSESTQEIYLILMDEINESYQLKLYKNNTEYQIEIIQIFQKMGNLVKLQSFGLVDNYFIQLYGYEQKNYICLYMIEKSYQVTNCRAGLKLGSQNFISLNFIFRKNINQVYQLLINIIDVKNLIYYELERESKIIFKSTTDIENMKINLFAINPFEQQFTPLNIKLIPCEDTDNPMKIFFILLIVVLGVLCLGVLICIAINVYLNKHRKRRRSYKTNL